MEGCAANAEPLVGAEESGAGRGWRVSHALILRLLLTSGYLAPVVQCRCDVELFTHTRNWIWIAPLLLAAGCSKPTTPATTAQNPQPEIGAPLAATPGAPRATAPAPAPAPGADRTTPDAAPVVSSRRELTIPSGAALRVRLDETVSTKKNRSGDAFTATLVKPVVVRGETVIPSGTRFRGHLTEAAESGRMQGRPVLALTLDSFHLNGKEHRLRTSGVQRVGPAHKKRNAILIGGGAGLGAAIGAIAGGGKGAAIGALAGGGAGTAGAYATGKEQLTLPAETPLAFTLRAPVEM